MTNKNFKDISYLKVGNEKQQRSYEILKNINIFNILKEYNPLLVGTIPIEVDIDSSDLDLICKVDDKDKFENILRNEFSKFNNFNIKYQEDSIIICNFIVDNIEIEIYASNIDSEKSNGYRHMLIEYRLLNLYGEWFKKEIIKLKKSGLKTEPAFAKLLNLTGNPYDKLLDLENLSNDQLVKIYKK